MVFFAFGRLPTAKMLITMASEVLEKQKLGIMTVFNYSS
jgi:hypothetical protein